MKIKQEPIKSVFTDFTWLVTIERNTIEHSCAIDSGMQLVHEDRDMLTYSGDKTEWLEYLNYTKANHKAIQKEKLDRYRY